MFSVNFVTFAFSNFYSVMTALKMSPVIDAFKVVSSPAAKQRIFNHNI